MIATKPSSSSGATSGVGFAIAKTIAPSAIVLTASTETAPGPLSPRKTSAPASSSFALPVDGAVPIAADDFPHARGEQDLRHRDAGCADAREHDLHVLRALADEF